MVCKKFEFSFVFWLRQLKSRVCRFSCVAKEKMEQCFIKERFCYHTIMIKPVLCKEFETCCIF